MMVSPQFARENESQTLESAELASKKEGQVDQNAKDTKWNRTMLR